MNREIKFRGQQYFTNEWVYGHYTQGLGSNCYISHPNGAIWLVKPETVGQYTHLNDKNGKEIYDGDIVEGGASQNGVVTFENGTFTVWKTPLGWMVEDLGYEESPYVLLPESWAEVIGNIHDNPELINR